MIAIPEKITPWMTSNTSIDNEGHITQNLGLTETLLDDGNLSYSVQQGYNSEGKTANGSASMDYKGAFADARVGYNYSDNGSQQQLNYALSGSLVAHSQGITLGQSLGETNADCSTRRREYSCGEQHRAEN